MVALLLSLTEWLVPMPLALQPFTGADGVKVPLVTEAEKAQRRANRRKRGPKARRRRKRMPRGSDQPYKKFKRVAFYDPSKEHQSPTPKASWSSPPSARPDSGPSTGLNNDSTLHRGQDIWAETNSQSPFISIDTKKPTEYFE